MPLTSTSSPIETSTVKADKHPLAASQSETKTVPAKEVAATDLATAAKKEKDEKDKDKNHALLHSPHDFAELLKQYNSAGNGENAAKIAKGHFDKHFDGKPRFTTTSVKDNEKGTTTTTYHDPKDPDNKELQVHITTDSSGKPIKIEAGKLANSVTSPIPRGDGSFEVLEVKGGKVTSYSSDDNKSKIAGVHESMSIAEGALKKEAIALTEPTKGSVTHHGDTTRPDAPPSTPKLAPSAKAATIAHS